MKIKDEDIVIRLKDVVTYNLLGSREDGQLLRQAIEKPLKDGQRVFMDFTGIAGTSIVAIQEAFAAAYNKYGDELFEKKLLIKVPEGKSQKNNPVTQNILRVLNMRGSK